MNATTTKTQNEILWQYAKDLGCDFPDDIHILYLWGGVIFSGRLSGTGPIWVAVPDNYNSEKVTMVTINPEEIIAIASNSVTED